MIVSGDLGRTQVVEAKKKEQASKTQGSRSSWLPNDKNAPFNR